MKLSPRTACHHHDQQRPQPELKPAASWLLRLSGVGFLEHGGIVAGGPFSKHPEVEAGW